MLIRQAHGSSTANLDGQVDEIAFIRSTLRPVDIREAYSIAGMTPSNRVPKSKHRLSPKPRFAAVRTKVRKTAVLHPKPVAFWRLHDESNSNGERLGGGQHDAKYETDRHRYKSEFVQPNFAAVESKIAPSSAGNTLTSVGAVVSKIGNCQPIASSDGYAVLPEP